jgi:hypothetical protein
MNFFVGDVTGPQHLFLPHMLEGCLAGHVLVLSAVHDLFDPRQCISYNLALRFELRISGGAPQKDIRFQKCVPAHTTTHTPAFAVCGLGLWCRLCPLHGKANAPCGSLIAAKNNFAGWTAHGWVGNEPWSG